MKKIHTCPIGVLKLNKKASFRSLSSHKSNTETPSRNVFSESCLWANVPIPELRKMFYRNFNTPHPPSPISYFDPSRGCLKPMFWVSGYLPCKHCAWQKAGEKGAQTADTAQSPPRAAVGFAGIKCVEGGNIAEQIAAAAALTWKLPEFHTDLSKSGILFSTSKY